MRGKLGALPPGPAALLPRTCPSSNDINGLYGHGFYGNGYTATAYGNGYRMLEIRNNNTTTDPKLKIPKNRPCVCAGVRNGVVDANNLEPVKTKWPTPTETQSLAARSARSGRRCADCAVCRCTTVCRRSAHAASRRRRGTPLHRETRRRRRRRQEADAVQRRRSRHHRMVRMQACA